MTLDIAVWLRMSLELSFEHLDLFFGQAWARQNLGTSFKFLLIGGDGTEVSVFSVMWTCIVGFDLLRLDRVILVGD